MESQSHNAAFLNEMLINEMKQKGSLASTRVEAAFRAVPRHLFLPGIPLEEIYSDQTVITKWLDGHWVSSSSQPSIMATMLSQLNLLEGQKVLEIGSGTGYNAALLSFLAGEEGRVYTIDIFQDLVQSARQRLQESGFSRVQVIHCDGSCGYPKAAPYDRIIVTVGSPEIAPAWWEQLDENGILVLPLDLSAGQKSIALQRHDDYLISLSVVDCGFMPMQGELSSSGSWRIRLGSSNGLYLETEEYLPVQEGSIYAWLSDPRKDWETGIELTKSEYILSLRLWLALQKSCTAYLVAIQEAANDNLIPPFVFFLGEWKSIHTTLLVGESGMAALTWSPGLTSQYLKMNIPLPSYTPFRLYVRQFGTSKAPAQKLVKLVQDWDKAGRPNSEGLRIRVFPKGHSLETGTKEFILEKKWSRLVLDWLE